MSDFIDLDYYDPGPETYTCRRCGRKGKSSDEDAHEWHNINICAADTNIWHEENDSTLCPDCSKTFNDLWFDFIVTTTKIDEFIEDKSCSRCTKSKRLDSGAYECMERLYDIVDKTCFVPKKEVSD